MAINRFTELLKFQKTDLDRVDTRSVQAPPLRRQTDLTEFCAAGAHANEQMLPVTDQASLRVITFTPAEDKGRLAVLFIAGLISQIFGWKDVLREMTRDFTVYYVETREKASSVIHGEVNYSIESIGKDIVRIISLLNLPSRQYILFGSSLGATAILDGCRFMKHDPLCLVLVGPNAIFRIPKWSYPIIWMFPPRLYLLIKPVIRWYLRTFEVDVNSDYAQYEKYSSILDVADPWKLKKIAFPLARYTVWDRIAEVRYPTLIIGASKDIMHIPENLLKMVEQLENAVYLDMETNSATHSTEMVREMRDYITRIQKQRE